ncbi:helix-turn-helix transcriptional regulator [Saccharothrix sp.]|uniref:helix-turn-helix domain-containing protein n=1 Tax=Saccharothrix sp. TaxID=1873460 RepID=UPI00281260EE|nr:helix-turn-helix transcriptional regulator [Saccharothrix sp.]
MTTAAVPKRVADVIIGRKLAALRMASGMSQAAAGKVLDCTQNKIGNIERGDSSITLPDLRALFEHYRADEPTKARLTVLAKGREKRASRTALRASFQGTMREVVDLETSAHYLWQHNSMTIPGLLQTEAYMRSLFRAARPSKSHDEIEHRTMLRLRRQEIIDNVDQQFWFVIDQAALERMTNMDGSATIQREQKAAIVEAMDRPNVEVQVVPWHVGYYIGQAFTYTIFGFDSDPHVELVHVEGLRDGHVTSNLEEVNDYLTVWDHQRAAALGPEQSRAFLLTS